MRRYPFTVPGFARLVDGGGAGIVDRLRGGLEPLVMSILHYLAPELKCRAISSDEMNTLEDAEWPREWWVRTAFVPKDAPDVAKAKEYAWVSIEYSQWEEEETWAVQVFVRAAELDFSLSADNDTGASTVMLSAERLPTQDSNRIGEILIEHFGSV